MELSLLGEEVEFIPETVFNEIGELQDFSETDLDLEIPDEWLL
jgi:hypothetical protein